MSLSVIRFSGTKKGLASVRSLRPADSRPPEELGGEQHSMTKTSDEPNSCSSSSAQATLIQWIDEHSDYLLRYCKKYVRAEDVAEDLVQDTFLVAVQSYEKFQGRSAPRTWLVGILRHKIYDRLRIVGREEPIDGEALEKRQLDHLFDSAEHWRASTGPLQWGASPENVVSNRQFLNVLESCLGKLPDKFRAAFLLREMDELSRDEIAEKMNLTSNHVGVLLYRARAELQECLQTNWLKKLQTV